MTSFWSSFFSRGGITVSGQLPALATATIDDIAHALDKNHFTSVDLVRAYIARVEDVNHVVNAVLEINPDAMSTAAELDRERRTQGRRGCSPLHGVPILLKDNIFTLDRTATSAGSFALLGSKAPREGTVVERLRKAGAIILGKTNLSEWANFRSTNATNGWSARGGQTYGAFADSQSTEGSSSGSAVSMILGLATVSLGTETDGSIVGPAKKSSIVGLRTTTGLVPRDGVIPLSDRQDTVGPMTRTVKDSAYLLSVIAGRTQYDNATASIPFDDIPDYVEACQGRDLTGVRLGVPRNSIPDHPPGVDADFNKALEKLRDAGAVVIDNVKFRSEKEWDAWDNQERKRALEAEFKSSIARWCSELTVNPNGINSVDDIIEFTKSHPKELYPERNVDRLLSSRDSPGIDDPITQQSLTKMLRLCADDGILGALADYKLDALVFPNDYNRPSTFAARAGMPVMALPLGFFPPQTPIKKTKTGHQVDVAPNVPYGIAFVAEPYSETRLFHIAHVFEQAWALESSGKLHIVPKTEIGDVKQTGRLAAL
ncbi:hypothetical protein H9Q74_005164 [Fusarium xylarioides]|nr:hypothetical protein H9Q71_011111 [Fusarium xylarioides]KAG5824757.1 hypothetical protein H9Q74_005164 [Fusarium xylarioides]